jgi:hypothetical protein
MNHSTTARESARHISAAELRHMEQDLDAMRAEWDELAGGTARVAVEYRDDPDKAAKLAVLGAALAEAEERLDRLDERLAEIRRSLAAWAVRILRAIGHLTVCLASIAHQSIATLWQARPESIVQTLASPGEVAHAR